MVWHGIKIPYSINKNFQSKSSIDRSRDELVVRFLTSPVADALVASKAAEAGNPPPLGKQRTSVSHVTLSFISDMRSSLLFGTTLSYAFIHVRASAKKSDLVSHPAYGRGGYVNTVPHSH